MKACHALAYFLGGIFLLAYLNINWEHLFQMLLLPFCIQLGALALGIFLNNLINHRLHDKLPTDSQALQYVFINALRGLPIAWCSGVGLYWTISSLAITPTIKAMLSYILFTIIILTLTRVIARTLVGMIDIHTLRSDTNLPKTSLLTNIANIFIYCIGILVVLQYYGISVTPIITALGVGGMAVALGLQETLANIFAGLHLILSKQLRLGDFIKLSSGEEGRVTDIAWRFTTIQSTTNNDIVVPNQKIASAILTNYNMPQKEIAVSVPVGVSYDSDLDQVEAVTLDVAREVMDQIDPGNAFTPAVRFHTFGDSSIKFSVSLQTHEFLNQYRLKHEFIKALTKRYRQEHIIMPYPIHTILQPKD